MSPVQNQIIHSQEGIDKKYRMNFLKVFACIILITLSSIITIPSLAQDKKDSSTNVDDPMKRWLDYSRPGKYHQLLANLVGNWSVKGRHYSGNSNPDSNKVVIEFSATAVWKSFANGRFFIIESTGNESQKIQSPIQDGKMVEVMPQSIETLGYDNVKKKFVYTFINNHLGSGILYSEGNYDSTKKTISYEFEYEMTPEMKLKVHDYFIILDNDHYTIEIYGEADGKLVKQTEMNYTRVKGK